MAGSAQYTVANISNSHSSLSGGKCKCKEKLGATRKRKYQEKMISWMAKKEISSPCLWSTEFYLNKLQIKSNDLGIWEVILKSLH